MILSPQDLEALTCRRRPGWQARVLDKMQPAPIPYRRRPDGTLVVLWSDVQAAQDVRPRKEPRLRLSA